jgi:acyl transferase domain-containing protein
MGRFTEGRETITFFKPEELIAVFLNLRNDPLYVGARGIIPNANTFDATFGINPKLAEVMDPKYVCFLKLHGKH